MAAGNPSGVQRTGADFNTAFVLQALVSQGLLSPEQGQEVAAKEGAARARVLKHLGGNGKEEARYEVSPVEIVAAFQIQLPQGRGPVLDQDLISQAVAQVASVSYRKIDPLKLDMALATRTVSKPFAQKHVLLPLEQVAGRLIVAVANPFDRELFENLQRLSGMAIQTVLC